MTTMEIKKFLTGCHIFIQCNIILFLLASIFFLMQYGLQSVISIVFIVSFTLISGLSFEYLRQYFLDKKRDNYWMKLHTYQPFVNTTSSSLVYSGMILKHVFLIAILTYCNVSIVNMIVDSHENTQQTSVQNATNLEKMIPNYD